MVEGAREIVNFEEGDACPICLDSFDPAIDAEKAWELSECSGHFFHAACIRVQLMRSGACHCEWKIYDQNTPLQAHYHIILDYLSQGKCAVCARAYIVQIGNQPTNGVMTVQTYPLGMGLEVEGYPAVGSRYHQMIRSSFT